MFRFLACTQNLSFLRRKSAFRREFYYNSRTTEATLCRIANTAAFLCSLLGLVSHAFGEGDSGVEISTR